MATLYSWIVTDDDAVDQDSDTLKFHIAIAPAMAPTPTATFENEQVTLSWVPPADTGIESWQVRQRADDEEAWTVWSPLITTGASMLVGVVAMLPQGPTYAFQIRALTGTADEALAGAPSESVSVVTGSDIDEMKARYADVNRAILPYVGQAVLQQAIASVESRVASLEMMGRASALRLGGQPSMRQSLLTQLPVLGAGRFNTARFITKTSFLLGAGGGGSSSIWGRGHYQQMSGHAALFDWEGPLYGGGIGVDVRLTHRWLSGVSAVWNKGTFTRTGEMAGSYDVQLRSVFPYTGWASAKGGWRLWGLAGYGKGQIALDADLGEETSDITMRSMAVGMSKNLLPAGAAALRAKGETSLAQMAVDGNTEEGGLLDALALETRRMRLAFETEYGWVLQGGGHVKLSLEVGVRKDEGDIESANDVDVGARLKFQSARGLMVEGSGHMLVMSTTDYREWGMSLVLRYDPGVKRSGLSLNLASVYGEMGKGVQSFWQEQEVAMGNVFEPAIRMDADMSYGLALGNSRFTPYARFALTEGGRQRYGMGGSWALSHGLLLELVGQQSQFRTGATAKRVSLAVRAKF